MRGASLRVKINLAILIAFLAAAGAFAGVLSYYMSTRQAAAQNRTRALLGALAAHRLEALGPMLDGKTERGKAQDIMNRLVRVDGVTEASLFDGEGRLLVTAGEGRPSPLSDDAGNLGVPGRRVFSVSADDEGKFYAALVEPVSDGERTLGYLRLRYSLREIATLNQHTWYVFALAVGGAYLLLAALLNLMLHRFVLHPVEEMRRGLEAVHSGRLDVAVPVTSRDALGRMAQAFNTMAARLKETDERLARSQAQIEEDSRFLACRVEERTEELARTNERLTDEIAARREAEARQERALALHRAILESKIEGVLCLGVGGERELLAVNARFLELWRLPGDWAEMETEARRKALREKLLDSRGAMEVYESLMADDRRQDTTVLALGDGRFLERRSGPVVQGEACIGRVFSYVDVTEEKLRQDAVERDKNRAEDASKAKGAFLAVMSHEIRTPLNVVIGLAEELLADPATETQREHLRSIQEAAGHLLGVVNDVLDFSKIEAGKLVLERGDVDLRQVLASVASVFAHEAAQKGLAFSAATADDVPAVLRGDAGRLRQILVNLTGNAVKFTAAGSVTVTVSLASAEPLPDGRLAIALRVADTGIGMDEEQVSRLFKDFEQGSGRITRRFGGTGLGLAIAKGLAVRMGGDVTVQSDPGRGSAFTCTVPLSPVAGTPPVAAGTDEGGERPEASRPLRILLVEDNALNAAVARLHMNRLGHDLTVAASAREAYAILARERFDAVLMDIEMPEVDGITAARAIRAGGEPDAPVLDPEVPIIAVTAHALEDMRQECQEAGMDGFVPKPINFKVLRDVLDAAGRRGHIPAPAATGSRPGPGMALFDPEAAREGMGIDRVQYLELCRVSFEEGTRRLAAAREAMAAGDPAGAAIDAHTIKAAAATLGAYSCREQARVLEKALRAGDEEAARQAHAALCDLWLECGRAFAAWLAREEGKPGA
ncbi:ATP-binding protein [Solidesulfovibrio sp.]|uniref:ATP-binding protein n=1 Tax=Solidesulfovibrio sp. TaxID=2910990 RepID=UPI00261C5884|nr:ATP-binding protein [Solidesulfovibrio sp.]